jgi:SAM-dependent methyltransferase
MEPFMLLYAYTIFTSAFLLFLIQPVIAKMILPWFGGSASVWTTCMLFFQCVLLLGYLYSHWSIRTLKPKMQLAVHATLLALSLAILPITPSLAWKPSGAEDPTFRIWGLLAACVGLPYFLLSTTGPLIQAWYARTHRTAAPYRLFALSNFASMLALVGYPILVEPFVVSRAQSIAWSVGYAFFTLLCAGAAWHASRVETAPAEPDATEEPEAIERPRWTTLLSWIALPACASLLLLAVTNHMCQDVASVPFLWVLPLTLYLVSFILSFDRDGWYSQRIYEWLVAAALGGMCYMLYRTPSKLSLTYAVLALSAGLFICCMFCHGEVARRKPHARHLTLFYLMISLGGALGSTFVALIAPRIFSTYYEYPIGLALCGLLALMVFRRNTTLYYCWAAAAILMCVFIVREARSAASGNRIMVRNFYGTLKVADDSGDGESGSVRKLLHGAINHGEQYLEPDLKDRPTTYYGMQSGVGLALLHNRHSAQRVGVIGLGTGTLAAYAQQGDYYRIYEINPLVIQLAKTEFTYLRDSKAQLDLVLGDARLSLERETPQRFDVLVVDAFSGDSIPVHLMTREAFQLYLRHLRPDGVLAVHISNRYLDLKPVVKKLADNFGLSAMLVDTDDDDANEIFGSTWILVTANQEFLNIPVVKEAALPIDETKNQRLWTDDYSNLFQILK